MRRNPLNPVSQTVIFRRVAELGQLDSLTDVFGGLLPGRHYPPSRMIIVFTTLSRANGVCSYLESAGLAWQQ